MSEKAFREAFAEPFRKGMAKADERAGLVWLPKYLKHNPPGNPNVIKSWAWILGTLPECNLYYEIIEHVKAFAEALPKAFAEALPIPFRKGMPKGMANQEQEQEQEQEQDILTFCAGLEATPAPKRGEGENFVIEIPTSGGKNFFGVTESQVNEWQALFPAIDVPEELRKCRAWNQASPDRRKTPRGVLRHIVGWLSRAQDKSRNNSRAPQAGAEGPDEFENYLQRQRERGAHNAA